MSNTSWLADLHNWVQIPPQQSSPQQNNHGQSYTRRGVSWRCTVDGMSYELLRHELQASKARSAELPRDESTNILACLEWENNQMQRQLNRFHAVQKARKHLSGKAQEWAIKSINEITTLDDDEDISDFSDSSNDDFQKFLPTNIRRCC